MDDDIFKSFNFMETFPLLDDLVLARNFSAHDKKGGNDNGFTNKAEFIRREGWRGTVLMDALGPGCVFHYAGFWMNHPRMMPGPVERMQLRWLGKINMFFDGESKPRISTLLKQFTGRPPFTYPLAFAPPESGYASVSYAPFPFRDRVRVTVDGGRSINFGLHFWYHRYPAGTKARTWTADFNPTPFATYFRPETAWAPAGLVIYEHPSFKLGPGESRDLFVSDRAGTVKCLRMDLPHDDMLLRNIWLRAWWDNELEPSIDAPLSLIFAVENRWAANKRPIDRHAPMRGVIVGQDSDGLHFLRLPMPFARGARISMENRGARPAAIARARIESDDQTTPGMGVSAGYLRTQFRESHDLTPGRDYLLAEIEGRGKIIGLVLAVTDTHENFLEGDERIYVDGSRSPAIIGDATETYFNGSWYFCADAFACPLHGAPTFRRRSRLGGSQADVTMYRFHPTDFVPFRDGARFSIQHGGFNELPGHYRSLVFSYHLPEPSLVQTDYLDLGDPQNRADHGFSADGPEKLARRNGFFEGDRNGQDLGRKPRPRGVFPIWWMLYLTFIRGNRHQPPADSPDRVSFTVASHSQPYQFTVRIDPRAQAVMLRRVLDQSVFDQASTVEVDGRPAGAWLDTGNNPWKIWAEDDLILDPIATAGKDRITIRIIPGPGRFTAAEYRVFSVLASPR